MKAASLRRATLALVVLLTLAGFALRFYRLNAVPLRGDEAFTVIHWMREPLAQTLDALLTKDPQPPLAIGLFRAWALVISPDDGLARVLPALVNTLGIPALYALGHRLGGRRVGLLAALLWAIHPYEIWHSQDARGYALWAALSAVGVWLALRLVQRGRRIDWLLYVLAGAAAAYLYYLELFVLLVLNLYVFAVYWRNRPVLTRWITSQAAIALILAPWYLQPRLLSGGDYGGTTGGFQPALLLSWFLPTLTFGETVSDLLWLWPVLLVLLVIAGVLWWRRDWRAALLPILLGTVPLVLLSLVSLRLGVFTHRYVLAAAPAYMLLVAGIFATRHNDRARYIVPLQTRFTPTRRLFAIFTLVAWLALALVALSRYYFDYAKTHDWPALVAYLSRYSSDTDFVVQAAADESFTYYFAEAGLTADMDRIPANPTQSADEIVQKLADGAASHDSLWRVATTFSDWPSYGIAERWLDENMQPVRDLTLGGLPVRQYMNWQVSADEIAPEPLARFDGVADLVGAQVADFGETTRRLTVWLYWQPLTRTETPLTVSVQLIGPTNPANGTPLWAQDDHEPQAGRVQTTIWDTGTIYRDVYALPLDGIVPGTYTVVARLYNPATGERVMVNGEDGYTVGEVAIG